MTRTSSVAIVPRINGMRAIPPPGLSRSCMNVIVAGGKLWIGVVTIIQRRVGLSLLFLSMYLLTVSAERTTFRPVLSKIFSAYLEAYLESYFGFPPL
jgi:hypothetical protein